MQFEYLHCNLSDALGGITMTGRSGVGGGRGKSRDGFRKGWLECGRVIGVSRFE